MRKILYTCLYQMRAGAINIRSISAALIITYGVICYVPPIITAGRYYGINISVGLIPVVCSDPFMLMFISLAALIMFSNLPIKRPEPYYLMSRGSQRKWMIAQISFVLIMSLLMVFFLVALSFIAGWGKIYITNDWGKILTAVTQGQLYEQFGITLEVGYGALRDFSVTSAWLWNITSIFLTFVIFGLISLVLNLFIYELAGTIVNGVIVFIHMFCGFFPTAIRYHFSPIDWCSIAVADISGYGRTPGVLFICVTRAVIIIGLMAAALILSGKKHELMKFA